MSKQNQEGNKEYKSDVFSMLLEYPENALEVYNALNDTQYDDPSQVEMTTLDKGISLSVRNDASFLLQTDLNLYEHQSTYNPNMPIRSLIYYVDIVGPMVREKDLYSRKRIKIAQPHFVVFYNGKEERPEKEMQYLSDSFMKKTEDPELEVKVTVYNINVGNNKLFLEKCSVLREYMIFVDKVRDYVASGVMFKESIEQAIEDCIQENVLKEFLISRKDEVTKVMKLDYTWERREELIRAEEREEGREEKIVEQIHKKLAKGKTVALIAEEVEENEETVNKLIQKHNLLKN